MSKKTDPLSPPSLRAKTYRGNCVSGKLTPEVRQKFLELYEQGISVHHASVQCGVTAVAIFKLRQRDPQFAADFLKAQELSVDIMEDKMLIAANDAKANMGHITAMFGILRARRPAVWGVGMMKLEHTGSMTIANDFAVAMEEMSGGIAAAQAKH